MITRERNTEQAQRTRFSTKHLTACALALALLIGRSFGEQLCGQVGTNTTTDQATGSVLVAGAVVVGVTSNADYGFSTSPTLCIVDSHSDERLLDCDGDGIVTLDDYWCIYQCLDGPAVGASSECEVYDRDGSGTVDMMEVHLFQQQIVSE